VQSGFPIIHVKADKNGFLWKQTRDKASKQVDRGNGINLQNIILLTKRG